MHAINITVEDREFAVLRRVKEAINAGAGSWKDMFLVLAKEYDEEIKKKDEKMKKREENEAVSL